MSRREQDRLRAVLCNVCGGQQRGGQLTCACVPCNTAGEVASTSEASDAGQDAAHKPIVESALLDRFAQKTSTDGKLLFCEKICDMGLAGTHAVLDWRDETQIGDASRHIAGVGEDAPWVCYGRVLARMQDRYGVYGGLPQHVAERVKESLQAQGREDVLAAWQYVAVFVEFVYTYTLEVPAFYARVNRMLGSAHMWQEKNGPNRYVGYTSAAETGYSEDEYVLLRDYAVGLIQSLLVLWRIDVLESYYESSTTPPFRGLPVSEQEAADQQNRRSRWVAFVSASLDKSVARRFGITVTNVSAGSGVAYKICPCVFDISALSEYPEEREVLCLPGVTGSFWGSNQTVHLWRYTAISNDVMAPINRACWSGGHLAIFDHYRGALSVKGVSAREFFVSRGRLMMFVGNISEQLMDLSTLFSLHRISPVQFVVQKKSPKQTLHCTAGSVSECNEWLDILRIPLQRIKKEPLSSDDTANPEVAPTNSCICS